MCRSPLAAAVLARALGENRVRGRALKDYEGYKTLPPAAKKVREYAARQGYDLDGHRAREVCTADYEWADVVYYMDEGNRARIPVEHLAKAVCLGTLIGRDRLPDPAFAPRGPGLERLLTWVVLAAEAAGRAQKETPGG